jgi:hypothetical protein
MSAPKKNGALEIPTTAKQSRIVKDKLLIKPPTHFTLAA